MEQPYETRILFLGLDGVGKLTIIAKLRDFKVFLLIIIQFIARVNLIYHRFLLNIINMTSLFLIY